MIFKNFVIFKYKKIIWIVVFNGWYWGCFNNLIKWDFLCNWCWVLLFKLVLNFIYLVIFLYCVNFNFKVFVIFFIGLNCVVDLIWLIDNLILIVGFIFLLNNLDFKKIWLLVIEIILVVIYVEILFVIVLIIGRVVKEFFCKVLDNCVVFFNKWECK